MKMPTHEEPENTMITDFTLDVLKTLKVS